MRSNKSSRPRAVGVDLRLQRLDAVELLLVAQTLHEAEPQLRRRTDPCRSRARWVSMTFVSPLSNVGRVPMFVIDGYDDAIDGRRSSHRRRAGGTSSLSAQRFAVGKPSSRPRFCSLHDRAVDRVVMAEQRACLVHPAFGDQPPHARAADDEVLVADRDRFSPRETRSARRGCAAPKNCRTRSWPNRKFAPTQTSRDVQPLDEHGPHERFRIPLRQLRRESDDGHAVHAGARERLELLLVRHQQRRRLVGPHDLRGMRIERHRDGRRPTLFGAAPHPLDDLQMTAVHAVEIPEGEHRLVPPRGPWIIWIVDDLHHRSISKVRPSYAN